MRESITTIILGHDNPGTDNIKDMLQQCPDKVIITGTAQNITDARKLIDSAKPELVFLDVLQQDDSMFRLFENAEHSECNMIIITDGAYNLNTLKYSAIAHIRKPLNLAELIFALNKHKQVMQLHAELRRLRNKQLRTIGLSNLNEIQFVHLDNIIRLEAASNYTHFHLDTGEKITVSYTLKHYEDILDHNDFMRVHQSHIINLNKVKKYVKGNGGYAIMEDGQNICIAPAKKNYFFKALHLA